MVARSTSCEQRSLSTLYHHLPSTFHVKQFMAVVYHLEMSCQGKSLHQSGYAHQSKNAALTCAFLRLIKFLS